MTETLKAIAARLTVLIELIENGETGKAMEIIKNLSVILPTPDQRHLDVVKNLWLK